MIDTLSPGCPKTNSVAEPDCAKRLMLKDCLDRRHHEAHEDIVDTGRYRCRYVVWGRGPALVMIPGMGMDALGYAMLMARLQTDFCCISYDLPDGTVDGAHLMTYRHIDLVNDLFALLDHLAIQRCFVLGSSFGSTIALSAVRAQPGRFPRAVLPGAFARRSLAWAEVMALSFMRYAPGTLGDWPAIERILQQKEGKLLREREPAVWKFFLEGNLRMPMRAFATRALMIHRLDLRPILPAIAQPVLLVCGDRDGLVGRTSTEELKAGLPSAALAEIENCGHLPQLTHPEVLAEVVGQFLQPGGPAPA